MHKEPQQHQLSTHTWQPSVLVCCLATLISLRKLPVPFGLAGLILYPWRFALAQPSNRIRWVGLKLGNPFLMGARGKPKLFLLLNHPIGLGLSLGLLVEAARSRSGGFAPRGGCENTGGLGAALGGARRAPESLCTASAVYHRLAGGGV